jgi:hypothetical protein
MSYRFHQLPTSSRISSRVPGLRALSTRGQAVLEFALLVPILLMLAIGTYDLGRGIADTTVVAGQVRAGLRTVQNNPVSDVGSAVRAEGASTIPNTKDTWGLVGFGNLDDCDPTQPTHTCGDPLGCASSSSFWTTPGNNGGPLPTGCFAVTKCTINNSTVPPTCPYTTPWGTRPAANTTGVAVVLRVVLKYTPVTPLIPFILPGAKFYLQRDGVALPLY